MGYCKAEPAWSGRRAGRTTPYAAYWDDVVSAEDGDGRAGLRGPITGPDPRDPCYGELSSAPAGGHDVRGSIDTRSPGVGSARPRFQAPSPPLVISPTRGRSLREATATAASRRAFSEPRYSQ